jgi:hypothetical protein
MRFALMAILLWAGTAWAQPAGAPPVGTPVVPGAEDGYFSAEDYRILKESRGDGSEETRSLVRTRDGVIVIRRQETPNGPRYQVMDHRARRHDGTVIIVPQQ